MGGYGDNGRLSSVELFPPSDACSIPDLPQPRSSHSLSLLSGGRLVVCGGFGSGLTDWFDSCNSWVAGNTSWSNFHTMRCRLIIFKSHNHLHHSMAKAGHIAWTPPSLPDSIVLLGGYGSEAELTAETVPGIHNFTFTEIKQNKFHIFRHARVSSTYPCQSVRWSVGP